MRSLALVTFVFATYVVSLGSALAQPSAYYLAGLSDRTSYEDWFAGLQGEYKTGVEYWVTHRSFPKEATCYASSMPPGSEWIGIMEQSHLAEGLN